MSEEKITDRLKRIRAELEELDRIAMRAPYSELEPGDWFIDGVEWREVDRVERVERAAGERVRVYVVGPIEPFDFEVWGTRIHRVIKAGT